MAIEILARGRCSDCVRYIPPPDAYTDRAYVILASNAMLSASASAVLDEAVRRGWSAYPLLCPDCAATMAARIRAEGGAHGPQDSRTVHPAGEDAERPGESR